MNKGFVVCVYQKIDNDDYMCTKINELHKCEWTHEGIESLKEIMFT